MDYQSNSRKSKEDFVKKEKPQLEKVVTGEVIQKPKSIGRKFKDIFFGGNVKDSARNVTGNILLPALRNMLFEAWTRGSSGFAEGLIYGDSRRRPIKEYRPSVSYHDPFATTMRDPRERPRLPDQNPYRRERRQTKDFIVVSREEADAVVEKMYDCINQYDVVSLADLLEILGEPSSHIDQKWGWTYLSNVKVTQRREGWLIDLPPVEAI